MGNRTLRILLRVFLAVSLIANAAMIGVVVRVQTLRSEMGLEERSAATPELRRAFLAAAQGDDALRAALQEVSRTRSTMMEMLQADPIDRDAVAAQMAAMRAATEAFQIEAHRVLLEAASGGD